MQIAKLAFKFMSKYLVGWDKIATLNLGGALPAEVEAMEVDQARDWLLSSGVLLDYRNAVNALGKDRCTVDVKEGGKTVKLHLDSRSKCDKYIVDFLLKYKFVNPKTGKDFTESDLSGYGAKLNEALTSVSSGLNYLSKSWESAPTEVKEFVAWERENGIAYQDAKRISNALARVNDFSNQIDELKSKNAGKMDNKSADMLAAKVIETFLFGYKSVKLLEKTKKSLTTDNSQLVNLVAERLVNERAAINFDKSIDDLDILSKEQQEENKVNKLNNYIADVIDNAKFLTGSERSLVEKIMNVLRGCGYAKKADADGIRVLLDKVSGFLASDVSEVIPTVKGIVLSKEFRSINRDASSEDPNYMPFEETEQESAERKVDSLISNRKKEFESSFAPLSSLSLDEIKEEAAQLSNKSSKNEGEISRLNKLMIYIDVYNKVNELKSKVQKGIASEKDKEDLEKAISYAYENGIKLSEHEDKMSRMNKDFSALENKIKEQESKDPKLVARVKYEKRNSSNKKDQADALVIKSQLKLMETKIKKALMSLDTKKMLSSKEITDAIEAANFVLFVLNADNPADDTLSMYSELIEKSKEVKKRLLK